MLHSAKNSGGQNRPWALGSSIYEGVKLERSGSGSIVGIATGYDWTVRWSNPGGGGGEFPAPVLTGPGAHPASCTMCTVSFPGGKQRPGRDTDPSPPSSAVGHERVELYLYSPYGPYGLYRASVPVQGVHFTFYQVRKRKLVVWTSP